MRYYQTVQRDEVIRALENSPENDMSTSEIADLVYGDPSMTDLAHSVLSGLEKLGIVERTSERGKGTPRRWRLT